MKQELDSTKKTILLRWLKQGKATFIDLPEIYNELSEYQRLLLDKKTAIELDRGGKIIVLKWLINGFIDVDDLTRLFPTFLELLQQSGIVEDTATLNTQW